MAEPVPPLCTLRLAKNEPLKVTFPPPGQMSLLVLQDCASLQAASHALPTCPVHLFCIDKTIYNQAREPTACLSGSAYP